MGIKNLKGVGSFFLTNLGIVSVAYLTYINHSFLQRVEYTLFHRTQEVAKDYFQDPAGLEVDITTNEEGSVEVYLIHSESGSRRPVLRDLLPSTPDLLEALDQRPAGGYTIEFIRLAREDLKQGIDGHSIREIEEELIPLYTEFIHLRE